MPIVLIALGLLANIQQASAECANACNGHGKCTSYDMCICNRNWQAADCSERVCMFGLAHVDTPKGDLDGSGGVTNADKIVIDNNYVYPYGTTEQFPQMQDSDLQTISDSAHYYMECSNKGTCDRTTGECQCFDGYDGVACQRASCPGFPNSCSGHGVCKTIRQLAEADNGNVYQLWDKHSTMGCECDAGYFGPDCSQRRCKYGLDPLYFDDTATAKYSIFDLATLTTASTATFTNGENDAKSAYWAIRFYDLHNEDWVTTPIIAGASCDEVTKALYALPNNVIPDSSIYCTRVDYSNSNQGTFTNLNKKLETNTKYDQQIIYQLALWEAQTATNYGEFSPDTMPTNYTNSNMTSTVTLSGYIYRLKFFGNPGALPQPDIEVNLDGKRPTLISPGAKVITKVWTDGQQGENNDYFADHCNGVTVTIGRHVGETSSTRLGQSFLNGMTTAEKNTLKRCLGDSDLDTTNNQDVYNWDRGSRQFPHLIKLVRSVTASTDGGYYAVVWYDTSKTWDSTNADGTFRLLNPFMPPDAFLTDNYDVYTTKGTLALTSRFSQAVFGFGSKTIYTTNTTYDTLEDPGFKSFDGDISCEIGAHNADKLPYIEKSGSTYHCLNKSDIFTFINWDYPEYNPPHINLYTAKRLMKTEYTNSIGDKFFSVGRDNVKASSFMTHTITSDLSTNWGASVGQALLNGKTSTKVKFLIYKFIPAVESTYTYTAECSNRGICDRDTAICKCFPGYTSDSCSDQSSLSV